MNDYLIWSTEHCGWWKANRHGYTTRTDLAGRFSVEEATKIVTEANRHTLMAEHAVMGVNEIMVPAPSRDACQLDMEYPDR